MREREPTEFAWISAFKSVDAVHGRLLSAVISEPPGSSPPPLSTAFKNLPPSLAFVLLVPYALHRHLVEGNEDNVPQNILQIPLPPAISSHSRFFLYDVLPKAVPFVGKHLVAGQDVCIACPTGKDMGPGVIVTVLSLFFDDNGTLMYGDGVENKGDSARNSCEFH